MQLFNAADREFRIDLHLDAVDFIRDTVKDKHGKPVDLLAIADEEFYSDDDRNALLNQLQTDRRLLVHVLYAAVTADHANLISRKEFRRLMTADVLGEASAALIREILNFFPSPRRETLLSIWEQTKAIQAEIQTIVTQTDSMTTQLLRDVLRNPSLLATLSVASPENSESTPDSSPTAN